MARAASGLRSRAKAAPKMVIGTLRDLKSRINRQNPAREPYS